MRSEAREYGVYFRLKKISCGCKDQASARPSGKRSATTGAARQRLKPQVRQGWWRRSRYKRTSSSEGLTQVVDQVIGVFQANGQANHGVGNTAPRPFLESETMMSCGYWLGG